MLEYENVKSKTTFYLWTLKVFHVKVVLFFGFVNFFMLKLPFEKYRLWDRGAPRGCKWRPMLYNKKCSIICLLPTLQSQPKKIWIDPLYCEASPNNILSFVKYVLCLSTALQIFLSKFIVFWVLTVKLQSITQSFQMRRHMCWPHTIHCKFYVQPRRHYRHGVETRGSDHATSPCFGPRFDIPT